VQGWMLGLHNPSELTNIHDDMAKLTNSSTDPLNLNMARFC
jgi:hypothetical protein